MQRYIFSTKIPRSAGEFGDERPGKAPHDDNISSIAVRISARSARNPPQKASERPSNGRSPFRFGNNSLSLFEPKPDLNAPPHLPLRCGGSPLGRLRIRPSARRNGIFRHALDGRHRHALPAPMRLGQHGSHGLRLPHRPHLHARPRRTDRRRRRRIRRHRLLRTGQRALLRRPDRPLRQPHRRSRIPARRPDRPSDAQRDARRTARPPARRHEGIRPRDVERRTAAGPRPRGRALHPGEPRRRRGVSGQSGLFGNLLVDKGEHLPDRIRSHDRQADGGQPLEPHLF